MVTAENSRIWGTILLTITIFSFSLSAYAQYSGGTGEPNDPYLITTAADLISISQNQGDWDKHFRLTADLDLTGMDLSDYTPIGTSQGSGDNYMVIPFQGIFDGNDHSIIGFTFSGYYTVGLFGIVDKGAYIMNLNLVDPNVQGWSWVGALVGELREATVTYCTIQGGRVSKPLDFRGSSVLYGGLIGCNSAGTVTMCHATCDVPAGNSRIGGLVGENLGIIQNCFATGTIGEEQIPRLHSGGLVGWNKGSITGSYATGDVYGEEYETGGLVGCNNGPVTHCHATGDIFGKNGGGGLVGINREEDDDFDLLMGTIVDCYATGSVHADGKGAGGLVGYNAGEISGSYATGRVNGKEDVGGLVGSNEYADLGRIADCYASGSVMGEKHVGGLVGINPGTISRCYAAGSVSGFEQAGGLIGVNSQSRGGRRTEGTVIACFWDIETSGQSSSAGGMGLFTPVMQNINPYLNAGWDFVDEIVNGPNDIWKMWEGYDYPRLTWKPGPNTPLVFVDINDPGFYGQMSKYEVTNAQYCDFLNVAQASGDITIDGNDVVGESGTNSGEDYIGQRYYRCDGSGYTGYGATNGGAARIHYNEDAFRVDEGFDNHPVTYVSWYGAMAFANYYGYYLPTEEQWQAVADYDDTYIYGCGQIIDPGIANYRNTEHPDGTTPVGSFGVYGYGMSDMAGNVWEWTSSSLDSNRIFRGGGMGSFDSDCDVSVRGDGIPYTNYWDIGFRVCR